VLAFNKLFHIILKIDWSYLKNHRINNPIREDEYERPQVTPIWFLIALLLSVSLACNLPFASKSGSATEEATQPSKANSNNNGSENTSSSGGKLVTKLSRRSKSCRSN
jgi:hypothetical protein